MGSAEDPTQKTSQPTTSGQEPAVSLPTTPTDWATAVQTYYSAAPPAFFSQPPVWGPQHMGMPYGTPIPYALMYGHHPLYVHPSAMTPVLYPVGESKSGEGGGKVTSGSADDCSPSGRESESEGTSGTRDDNTEQQGISRKRSLGAAFADGDNSQPIAGAHNNGTSAECSYSGKARTVSKLPVSAPGRAALSGPPTSLNIGMDSWNASHVGTVAVMGGANALASAPVAANGVMPGHQWKDERELKREKRKQSNRESARRSRIRKQQECEELARKVTELNSENSVLKVELQRLHEVCKDLEKENVSIMEELNRISKPDMLNLKVSTSTIAP